MSFPTTLIQKNAGLTTRRLAVFEMIQDNKAFTNPLAIPISTAKDNLITAREDLDTFNLPIIGEKASDNITSTEINDLQSQINTTILKLDTLKTHTDRLSAVTYDNSESDPQFKQLFHVARAYACIQNECSADTDAYDEIFGSLLSLDDLVDNLSTFADTIVDDIDDARSTSHLSSSSSTTSLTSDFPSITSISSTSSATYSSSSPTSSSSQSTVNSSSSTSTVNSSSSTSTVNSSSSTAVFGISSSSSGASKSSSSSSNSNSSSSSIDLNPKAVLYDKVERLEKDSITIQTRIDDDKSAYDTARDAIFNMELAGFVDGSTKASEHFRWLIENKIGTSGSTGLVTLALEESSSSSSQSSSSSSISSSSFLSSSSTISSSSSSTSFSSSS